MVNGNVEDKTPKSSRRDLLAGIPSIPSESERTLRLGNDSLSALRRSCPQGPSSRDPFGRMSREALNLDLNFSSTSEDERGDDVDEEDVAAVEEEAESEVERIVQRLERRNKRRISVTAAVKQRFLRLCRDAQLSLTRSPNRGSKFEQPLDRICHMNTFFL